MYLLNIGCVRVVDEVLILAFIDTGVSFTPFVNEKALLSAIVILEFVLLINCPARPSTALVVENITEVPTVPLYALVWLSFPLPSNL